MLTQRWFKILLGLIAGTILFQYCVQRSEPLFNDPRGMGYAGAAACVSCHASTVAAYAQTAHHNTTTPADEKNIKGSFHNDSNRFHYRTDLEVVMEKKEGKFFQTAYEAGQQKTSFPFDIVIGSGRKAQTFLYWQDSNAYQLPVTYSVIGKCWVNSPNYPTDKVRFDRVIPIGCFECHASFVERTGMREEKGYRIDQLNKQSVIYGIDCERCHGPGAAHVAYQQEHPAEKLAKYILTYKNLTNIQKMENCATCHSGLREPMRSPFLFKPGNFLKDFYRPDTVKQSAATLDVHGNQYQLLMESQCFKGAVETMSCGTCHDPHKMERNDMKVFSTRCMSCHQQNGPKFCKMAPKLGATIVNNCIDCHMPAIPSKLISLQSEQAGSIANLVRSHLIAKYPDATSKYLKSVRDE
ncbi:multiheme c-type cytochrome [Sediminibacterium goheungense]|uniref:Cytochrome c554/c'-like protein n=1 Tax=Sediminibacterium goheungense TaxID=1086393 RepID=A0A4R6J186_9BACT|nr:multiheme c-type cytochrome [Sediminibacterium goheungense]TDO29002.1 cytochrome c554/c'-like protein [Sediminibacterium goheungense]